MTNADFDTLIDSMYRGPRAATPDIPAAPRLPTVTNSARTRAQRTYVPDAARAAILDALKLRPQSTAVLAAVLDRAPNTVQTYLWRLHADGLVAGHRDVWWPAAPQPAAAQE